MTFRWSAVVWEASLDAMTEKRVWADALALPAHERKTLARELLEGVEGDAPDPEQLAEIERRLDDVEAGTATLVPWEEMRERLVGWGGGGGGRRGSACR